MQNRACHVKFIYRAFLSALSQSTVQETAKKQAAVVHGLLDKRQAIQFNLNSC